MSEAQVEPRGQVSCFSLPYPLLWSSKEFLIQPFLPLTCHPSGLKQYPSPGLCRGLRSAHPASLLQACHSHENVAFWVRAPLAPYFKIPNMHSNTHISEPPAFLSSHTIDHCHTPYFTTFLPCLSLSLSDSHCSGRFTEIKDFCLIHALLWPQVLKQWLAHNNTEYISVTWMKVSSLPPLPLILWIEHLIGFHPLLFYFWELGVTFTIFKTDKVSHTPTHLLPNSLRIPTQVWA